MEQLCYLNGEILPVGEAKVGVYDIGLLRGFGVYEALRTFDRKPFMLADHLKRMRRSAASMKLQVPASDEKITSVLDDLIARNVPEGKEALARFILTGGEAVGGIEYGAKPTFYILVEELTLPPAEAFERGCSLIVHEHERPFFASKTTNYIQAVLLQDERKRAGALEILYTWRGKVLECATSNFFIVKNGTIATAKETILEGITRKVVIDLAKKEFPLEERDISVDEMYAADEAFLTSSFKDVVPVIEVANRKIGEGMPGPVTKRVMELFHAFTHAG
jgi:branched-chain amino acid aminotransferase